MINVLMDERDALQQLNKRVGFWTDDPVTRELFEMYYEHMLDEGCFDGREFDVMAIVDNDYVNWLNVITEDEFDNYYIEDEDDDRIEERTEYDGITYYLIRA